MSSFKTNSGFWITIISICVTVSHSQIVCVIEPLKLELDTGSSGMLTCSCQGTTATDEMWWCQDNQECAKQAAIEADPANFLTSSAFNNGLLVGVLTVLDAQSRHSGLYYCKTKDGGSFDASIEVSNGGVYKPVNETEGGGEDVIKEVVVMSSKNPEIIASEKTPVTTDAKSGGLHQAPYIQMTPSENQVITTNEDIEVKCSVINAEATDITWYKEKEQLHTEGSYEIYGNTLTVKSPGSDQAGTYSCQAIVQNNNGSALQLEHFITLGEPISIKATESVKYTEGEIARVVCIATSSPLPTISWFLDGLNITNVIAQGNTSHYQEVGREDGPHGWKSTLRVLDLSFADAGLYNCSAFNGVVHEYRTIDLKVQDRMAAVWPFLGIVGECTFLIIVILIHEKCTEENYEEEEYNEETIKINKKHDPINDKNDVRDREN
ncbi:neural cell adhesion molecule 2-like isoform X1 [Antedon mediterranea]|uniref:neural cell adhesion molecule 2-like isoform X1 n=1 Tax=Antedon mediterranea TaxID=105859 RepID=UPI003AF40CF1